MYRKLPSVAGSFYPTAENLRTMNRHPSEEFDDKLSLNSSYTDLLEASGVEIRDAYEGSVRGIPSTCNPVTNNLRKCKRSVILPYYKMLSLIAWRPFAKDALKGQCCFRIINFFYPLIIVGLLLIWYVAEILTCQGRLSIDQPLPLTTAIPIHPTPSPNKTISWSDLFPAHRIKHLNSSLPTFSPFLHPPCTHVFGTYVVRDALQFLAYLVGFYHFRIQENEGLYALMEKVYLQSYAPNIMTRTLRIFLYCGLVWLAMQTAISLLFMYTFGLEAATGFLTKDKSLQFGIASLIVLAQFFANCVNVCVVINFGGQCQLLKYYIDGIAHRLEEKASDLRFLMRDILDVKENLIRLNRLPSLNTSFLVFNMILLTCVGFVLLLNNPINDAKMWTYRTCFFLLWLVALIFTLTQAARVTAHGHSLKEKALAVRVFGYQTYTQIDIDSFLNFLNMVELEAQIFTIPIKPPYLFGILVVTTQILILLAQTGLIHGKGTWL